MIDECHYHLCNKTQVRVHKCKHCGKYFCKEHLKPRKPSAAPFKSTDPLKQLEWREDGGHPCPDYIDYLSETRVEETEEQLTSLNRMNVFSPRYEIPSYQPTYTMGEPISENKTDKSKSTLKSEIENSAIDNSFEGYPQDKETDVGKDSGPSLKSEKELEVKNEETKSNSYKTGTKNKKPSKFKHTVNKYSYDIKKWFFRKKHPRNRLRINDFIIRLGVVISLSFLFWLTHINSGNLNSIELWIFRLGAVIQIIIIIFILMSVYKLLINLKYGIRGLGNGYKVIGSVIAFLFCAYFILNANVMVSSVTDFDYGTFNPFDYDFNNSEYLDDLFSIAPSNEDEVTSIEELKIGSKSVTLTYYLHGQEYDLDYTVYKGLNDYLASLPRSISYYTTPPTTKDFIMRDINQEQQCVFLSEFVESITAITDNEDDQVRIAVSIVQQIPYDWSGYYSSFNSGEFPYEVLYTQSGVCGEKSNLLVFLLRELGFGVAVLEFESDSHRAVGIKCPMKYSYHGTGYCFVETTSPTIITDSEGDYIGVGKLSDHVLISIADGKSFESVSEEYYDNQELNHLNDRADESGGVLSQHDYNRWWELVNKYGIEVD